MAQDLPRAVDLVPLNPKPSTLNLWPEASSSWTYDGVEAS